MTGLILTFEPENIGLNNVKSKLYQILTKILANSCLSAMAAIIGFLPISSSRFARFCKAKTRRVSFP